MWGTKHILSITKFFLLALLLLASSNTAQADSLQRGTWTTLPSTEKNTSVDYSLDTLWRHSALFRFNTEMIDSANIGLPIKTADLPFTISPDLGWTGAWLDSKTLQISAQQPFPYATKVTLTPRDNVTSIGNIRLNRVKEFTPLPLLFRNTEQTEYRKNGSVIYRIRFENGKVAPATLEKHLRLATKNGTKIQLIGVFAKDGQPAARELFFSFKPKQFGEVILTLDEKLTSTEGPQPLGADAVVVLRPSPMLEIKKIKEYQSETPPWNRSILITTTQPVKPEVLNHYLSLSPQVEYKLKTRSGTEFELQGDFTTRPRVAVTIKKGMPNAKETGMLAEDVKDVVTFTDFTPSLAIGEQGTLAAPDRTMLVPLTTINVEKVQVVLREIPENSASLIAAPFFDSNRNRLSQVIATKTADVGGIINRSTERSINLKDLAGDKKGIFMLSVYDTSYLEDGGSEYLRPKNYDQNKPSTGRDNSESEGSEDYYYDDYYYNEGRTERRAAQKAVVISDIGLVARVLPDGLTVWANSLVTAAPLENTLIQVYSSSNLLLAEGKTTKEGLYTFKRDSKWDAKAQPAIIVASTPAKKTSGGLFSKDEPTELRHHDDMTFLLLKKNLIQGEEYETGGKPYLSDGYEAFCFTPRGVYRPGETVPFKMIVRDNAMKAPKPFPVHWKIRTSTGRTAGQGVVTLSEVGGGEFSLDLVPSTPTGTYNVEISLPGQKGTIGTTSFNVEDLQPPRLEVKLTPKTPAIFGDNELDINIEARYLFDAPAQHADYEGTVQATPYTFTHKDWKTFIFPHTRLNYRASDTVDFSGTLDEQGKVVYTLQPSEHFPKATQLLHFTIKVQEDGGRFVANTLTIPYFPEGVLFGFEETKQEATAGAGMEMRVCALSPEGKALDLATKIKVMQSNHYYSRSERGNIESIELKPDYTGTLELVKGVGTFAYTPKDAGEYVLVVQDPKSGVEAAYPFTVWPGAIGSEQGASPIIDKVMLSWDKPRYAPGEKATLTVRSPFAGRMLFVVENNQERICRVEKLSEAETKIVVPVSDELAPNSYVSVWVVRPMEQGKKWGAHRAFGLIPLPIDLSANKITVDLDTQDEILPQKDLPVTITLKDKNGKPVVGEVSVALIDEGLLALTKQKTPNPYEFFTVKRALATRFFDRYDDLLPFTSFSALAFEVGGDGFDDEASLASPITRNLELLSIVRETVTTNNKGQATLTLKLPEYSGKGRLIAVAASKTAVGSADKNIHISRDVTVEATTPRMVAPDDSFIVPVFLYAAAGKNGTATVEVSCEGPLEIVGTNKKTFNYDTKNSKARLDVTIKALQQAGLGTVVVRTSLAGDTEPPFEQRIEVPVRPPFARVVKTFTGTVTGEAPHTITFPDEFFKGSQKMRLAFSESPEISLASALEYLGDYPHGCLEQTTSTLWPYLGVPNMLKAKDPEMADNTSYQRAIDFGVRRILSMQRPDGGFVMWPGDSLYSRDAYSWGSVYASHLLTELRSSGSSSVPTDAFKQAVKWMKQALSKPLTPDNTYGYGLGYELSTRAYIAFVLTLNGEPPLGWMQFLQDQGDTLNTSAKIYLAGAYALSQGKSEPLKVLGTERYKTADYGWSYETPARNEALRLLMWALVDPFAPEAAMFAKNVLEDGTKGRWTNTQENAMAVLALGKYMEKTAPAKEPFVATLTTKSTRGNEIPFMSFTQGKTPSIPSDLLMPDRLNAPKPLTVSLSKPDGGTTKAVLYYSLTASGTPTKPQPAESNGVTLFRRWTLPNGTHVNSYKRNSNGTYAPIAQKVEVAHGDKIDVTLYIEATRDVTSLILTDIVPGGFELENPNLIPKSEYENRSDYESLPDELRSQWELVNDTPPFGKFIFLNRMNGARAEMRDDRLLLYINQLPKYSAFTYSLRATSKGTFIMPPVHAEGMYDTEIKGTTMSGTAVVRDKEKSGAAKTAN